ncbi:MAG: PIN domain-containing protein [Candidatus Methanospirareceae archaeon]
MKQKCAVDTTVLLKVILEGDIVLLEKLANYMLFLPANVLEEASFKIIISSILDTLQSNTHNFYQIKRAFEQGKGESLISRRLSMLNSLKNKMIILDITDTIFDSSKELLKRFHLFPNDALIVATCKQFGIPKIATFDADFKRIDFLEVFAPE